MDVLVSGYGPFEVYRLNGGGALRTPCAQLHPRASRRTVVEALRLPSPA